MRKEKKKRTCACTEEEIRHCGQKGFSNSRLSWHAGQVSTNSKLSRCFRKGCVCVCILEAKNPWMCSVWGYEQHTTSDVCARWRGVCVNSHPLIKSFMCLCMQADGSSLLIKHICSRYKHPPKEPQDTDTTAPSRCSCQIHHPNKQTCARAFVSFSDMASGKPNHS